MLEEMIFADLDHVFATGSVIADSSGIFFCPATPLLPTETPEYAVRLAGVNAKLLRPERKSVASWFTVSGRWEDGMIFAEDFQPLDSSPVETAMSITSAYRPDTGPPIPSGKLGTSHDDFRGIAAQKWSEDQVSDALNDITTEYSWHRWVYGSGRSIDPTGLFHVDISVVRLTRELLDWIQSQPQDMVRPRISIVKKSN
ncbi:hypothetical protein NBRGN_109_00060 [Nocardia brasiliensis NBRC 14402]|uniref:hypothetical protein n=1 Tax=Nocardia brasiliensis TaxID=37326 RepID=UPI00045D2333|nr:hypothetical protein [Nocardia brasiliensis]GAJ86306.1 hypothetical protein NBRGN_109_00060 [Nocardia brasiliensis NBRC 14402]